MPRNFSWNISNCFRDIKIFAFNAYCTYIRVNFDLILICFNLNLYFIAFLCCINPLSCIPAEYGDLNILIHSKYRKIRTRGNSVFGHFSRGDSCRHDVQEIQFLLQMSQLLLESFLYVKWFLWWFVVRTF